MVQCAALAWGPGQVVVVPGIPLSTHKSSIVDRASRGCFVRVYRCSFPAEIFCHPAKMSQPLMSVAGHDWEEKFFLYGKRGPWVAMTGGGLSTGMIVAVLCVEEVVEG